jgi:GAF domain-containing protein
VDIAERRITDTFVRLADTLVDPFDVIDLLHVLTTRCVELLEVQAAGLMLSDLDGHMRVSASSSQAARLVELFELQHDEGPCLDCHRTGEQVTESDLATAGERWPRFARRAVAAGYRSVQSFPMRLRGEVLGAMNLFGTEPEILTQDQLALAQAFTDIATISIVQDRLTRDRSLLAEQLEQALTSRVVIERATGIVAGRLTIDVDQAFALMRAGCRRRNRRLTDLAHDIVSGAVDVLSLH